MNKPTQIAITIVLAGLILAGGYWLLNRGYGETSPQGYKYSIALFTACNQKDKAKLEKVADLIRADIEAGELSDGESKWLMDIIDDGLNDRWQAANNAVRQLMKYLQELPYHQLSNCPIFYWWNMLSMMLRVMMAYSTNKK